METETPKQQTEAEKNIPEGLLKTIRRFSLLIELVHDVAIMRNNQKLFFRERENPKMKNEYLQKAREYEKRVDKLLDLLWPAETKNNSQHNLFN